MRHSKYRTDMSGATIVEFALVLIPFLLLLIGCMEFGRYFWVKHVMTSAAAEGARMAILSDVSDNEVKTKIEQVVIEGGVNATPECIISSRQTGAIISVTVKVPYEIVGLGGFVPSMLGIKEVSGFMSMVGQ